MEDPIADIIIEPDDVLTKIIRYGKSGVTFVLEFIISMCIYLFRSIFWCNFPNYLHWCSYFHQRSFEKFC